MPPSARIHLAFPSESNSITRHPCFILSIIPPMPGSSSTHQGGWVQQRQQWHPSLLLFDSFPFSRRHKTTKYSSSVGFKMKKKKKKNKNLFSFECKSSLFWNVGHQMERADRDGPEYFQNYFSFFVLFLFCFFLLFSSLALLLIPSGNMSTRFMLRQLFTTCFPHFSCNTR